MEQLIGILEEIRPGVDYENCSDLVTGGIFDSFAILSLVSEVEDAYDISIGPANLVPDNFNSARALLAMIERLQTAKNS